MMGWALGVIAGVTGYALLKQAVMALAVERKRKAAAMMLLNIFCLVATLLIIAVCWPTQLLPCGLAMTGSLVALSAFFWFTQTQKKKEEK